MSDFAKDGESPTKMYSRATVYFTYLTTKILSFTKGKKKRNNTFSYSFALSVNLRKQKANICFLKIKMTLHFSFFQEFQWIKVS